ncbi:MAG: GDYXXLXY domain-containing protein [Fusobacterium sp.]|nr:GDYXXLXY domain-containing protein [Fusobacterium sp.]
MKNILKNKKIKYTLLIFNFILVLVLTFLSATKEQTYRKQKAFYLKLAPIDPRSLMQGDYMRLNYEIVDKAVEKLGYDYNIKVRRRGYIVVKLDKNDVAEYVDVVKNIEDFKNKNKEDILFIAFKGNGYANLKINADTFLFQEGDAKLYENAKYSKVVVVNHKLRLLSLVDKILTIDK